MRAAVRIACKPDPGLRRATTAVILGAILAGGEARRFGSDKALAEWNGMALIDHVVAALGGHVDDLLICGRSHHALPSIPDRPEGGLGPLGGINAALHHASAHGFSAVLSVPCDTPLIDARVFTTLQAAGSDAYVRGLPVLGLWRSAHAPLLQAWLHDRDDRSMRGWIARIDARAVAAPLPVNVNHLSDLDYLPRQ